MIDLPDLALSVRQPWTYGIIFEAKDIENRSWKRGNPGLSFRGRVCVHASKGMTRQEYEDAAHTFRLAGAHLPEAHNLDRGGIIGTVEIVDIVTESDSKWFFGPKGLVLRDPRPVDFIPCAGALGFFQWKRHLTTSAEPPARWMLPKGERPATKLEIASAQGSLL
jgi:hypothetical protein